MINDKQRNNISIGQIVWIYRFINTTRLIITYLYHFFVTMQNLQIASWVQIEKLIS